MFSVIYNPGKQITAVVDGQSYVANADHPNFTKLVEAWKNGDKEKFVILADIPQTIKLYTQDKVQIKDGLVYYGGMELHNTLTERIVAFMNENLPFQPLVNFLENLMLNPSKRAVDELYNFLERMGITITEDGYFLAYKRVREDWLDFHSGTIKNTIGATISVPRNSVNEDWGVACAEGLHVGAIEYVQNFNSGGHVLIVKVHPKDVVSVPQDASFTKCRVCEYQVIKEYDGDLTKPLYTADAQEWAGQSEEWDSVWDDYEEDEYEEDDTTLDDEVVEAELVEDEDEDDYDDEFTPMFEDGEIAVHKQRPGNPIVYYRVKGDSYLKLNTEYVLIEWNNSEYEVIASDYQLIIWSPKFEKNDVIRYIGGNPDDSYLVNNDSFIDSDGTEKVSITWNGYTGNYDVSFYELV